MNNKLRNLYTGLILAQSGGNQTAEGVDNTFFKSLGKYFGGSTGSLAKETKIGDLIVGVLQILLLLAGSIAVIFLVIGGYQYVMSRGNEEAAEKAKKTISSAVIGLIVIVLSFVIISIIAAVLLKAPTATELGV